MKCVFDHFSIQYMLEQFPRNIAGDLWALFENCCKDETIISQCEAQKCLENIVVEKASLEWIKKNSALFKPINGEEARLLGDMMGKNEFEFFNSPQLAERRIPESIPFILCIAKSQDRIFVYRKNTNTDFIQKIKKICTSYGIEYIEVEECLFKLNRESNT
jgi:hypothetical protein